MHRRALAIMTQVALATACLLTALPAACSGGSSHPPTPTPEPPGPALTDQQVADALLRVQDLPPDWTIARSEPSPPVNDPLTRVCGKDDVRTKFTPQTRVEATFASGVLGPFLTERIAVYATSKDAKAAADYVRDQYSCSDWTAPPGPNGRVDQWKLSPLSFPALGTSSFAIRITADGVPLVDTARLDNVVVVRGRVVYQVTYTLLGTGDTAGLESFARKADERAAALK